MVPIYDKPPLGITYQKTLTGSKIETANAVSYIQKPYQTSDKPQNQLGKIIDIFV